MGQAQLRVVTKTSIEVRDTGGAVVRSFGDEVPQHDGPKMSRNAAGNPSQRGVWSADDVPGVDARLLDALQIYLTPIIQSDDLWSIEWRMQPELMRDAGKASVRCRLIIHRRSARKDDAGILGVREGYPSWELPS